MEMNTTNKTAKEGFNGARKAIDNFADKAADKADQLESTLSSKYETFREGAVEGYEAAVDTVKKYPLYAVLGSTAIGLLAGVLFARRRDH